MAAQSLDRMAAPLRFLSVFGPLAANPTKNDCSDAQISTSTLVPTGAAASWDTNRKQLDKTGFIATTLGSMPRANAFRQSRQPCGHDRILRDVCPGWPEYGNSSMGANEPRRRQLVRRRSGQQSETDQRQDRSQLQRPSQAERIVQLRNRHVRRCRSADLADRVSTDRISGIRRSCPSVSRQRYPLPS